MEFGLTWPIFYMANSLNWSGFLHCNWSELIRVLTWKMIWIDHDFYMKNGLDWSGSLHGKWSELIRVVAWPMIWIDQGFTWQMVWIKDFAWWIPYFWADSPVEDLGGSSNLRESAHRRCTFIYCTAEEVDPIMKF